MHAAETGGAASESADWPAPSALPHWAAEAVERAATTGEDVGAALQIATVVGAAIPPPGGGGTALRWATLSALGRANLTVARVVEAHTDALAILDESNAESDAATGIAATGTAATGTWGVFAAETAEHHLVADAGAHGMVTLSGVKPWCSLGHLLDHALVTAHVPGGRGLFAVDLTDPSVRAVEATGWVARGLRTVVSVPVAFDRTPARPVGAPNWYLRRPGFAWGGMGVAAVWHGGAAGFVPALHRAASASASTGQLLALHAGSVDAVLHASAAVLADAARRIDAGQTEGPAGELLALRVRAVVADAVERVLSHVGHALGPAPLAFDAQHAARVADLGLYVRQHHAERDLADLGRTVTGPHAS